MNEGPEDARKSGTHDPSRFRGLAWLGGSASGGVLLIVGILLVVGLSWLARLASHESSPIDTPGVAMAPPVLPAAADRENLPPSVKQYLAQTIYPPGAGPLTAEHGDLLHPNRRFEDYRPIPETFSLDANQIVTVRLTSDRYYYEGDAPIELSLEVLRGNDPVEPLSLDAGATREGRAGLEGRRTILDFRPDAGGYLATLDPARFADHHGPLLVDAQIEYEPGLVHEESLRLFLTPEGRIPARFTGDVDDALVNGHLRIDVGVDVEQSGQYRIDANLYDRAGRPVSFAAFKGRLDRSDRTVPIEFFGRVLRDVGANGPYTVGEIRGYRFLDGDYPDRERIPDLPGRHRTGNYALSDFSAEEFMSPHKQRMVALLMEDVERGIAIEPPPTAQPSVEFSVAPSDPSTRARRTDAFERAATQTSTASSVALSNDL